MAQAGGLTTEQPQIPPEYPWRQQDSETKCSKCGGKRAISCTLREARVHTWEQNQHCKINKTLRPSLKNLTRIPQGSSKTLFIFTRSSAESILSGTPVAFYLSFFFFYSIYQTRVLWKLRVLLLTPPACTAHCSTGTLRSLTLPSAEFQSGRLHAVGAGVWWHQLVTLPYVSWTIRTKSYLRGAERSCGVFKCLTPAR